MTTPTASYASGVSDTPLIGQTIGENLARTAHAVPEREALVEYATGRRLNYAELDAAVDLIARGLLSRGIERGDRVGIWAPNVLEWVLVQYATARIGAVLVNINPAYRDHELGYVLTQSGTRMLVSALAHKTSDYRAMVEQVREQCPDLTDVVFIGDPTWAQLEQDGLAVSDDALSERAATLAFDDPVNIQYTSGTTGFPKGATLTHHNLLNNGFFVGELCDYTRVDGSTASDDTSTHEPDRICIPVPFYHCFGMVMGNLAATSHGACMVIPAAGFDPVATLEACARERCTSLYGVPTMFIAELADPSFAQHDLSALRTGIMAGSPCPEAVMKRVIDEMNMTEVTICYGMTETSPVSTQTRAADDLHVRTATVGRVHPHLEIMIVDPSCGLVVPRGVTGELCTRGYSVMRGYWGEPDRTADVLDAAGWMHTGDLAEMDEAGNVAIVGRSKDMVIRGGENIYPREIEEFLYTHPDVEDVQVVGVPDEKYGEQLLAAVRVRSGAQLSADQVREFCRASLAHFKVPRYVQFVQDYPMTVTGKIQKYRIREQAADRLAEFD